MIEPDVLGLVGEKLEIFRSIVGFNAVDVVNHFGRVKEATEFALDDQSVFIDMAVSVGVRMVWHQSPDIAICRNDPAPVPSGVTCAAHVVPENEAAFAFARNEGISTSARAFAWRTIAAFVPASICFALLPKGWIDFVPLAVPRQSLLVCHNAIIPQVPR